MIAPRWAVLDARGRGTMDYQSHVEEEGRLRAAIQRLRGLADEPTACVDETICTALGEVLENIEVHFSTEEGDGFFDQVVMQHPELDSRVCSMQDEHQKIRACFRTLLTRSQDGATDGLNPQILAALDELMNHEAAELRLMQDSSLVDIGPGD